MYLFLSLPQLKTLTKLLTSQVPLDEAHSLLEPLTRNKSTASVVKQVLQDFKLLERQLEKLQVLKKLKVLFSPGLVLNMAYFDGLIFSFCSLEESKKSRKGSSQLVLARGGQYNKLLESLREKRQVLSAPYSSPSSLPPLPSLSGVSFHEEVLVKVLCKTYVDTGQSPL
ncbi:PREDICTED: uncharacterized protein LOC109591433, partial [Amphimedon queenslandica]|uniref:Uncharacterized protein n=1 Tax=Amphimedon queenslandica TaxID=400682 RepID=A0AAN0K032_AMPQE